MDFAYKFALLVKVAARRSGPRYEIDELVNEAWISKQVRDADNPKYVCMAAHWAMLKYIGNDSRKQKQLTRYFSLRPRCDFIQSEAMLQ